MWILNLLESTGLSSGKHPTPACVLLFRARIISLPLYRGINNLKHNLCSLGTCFQQVRTGHEFTILPLLCLMLVKAVLLITSSYCLFLQDNLQRSVKLSLACT